MEIVSIILLNMYKLNPAQTWIAFSNSEVKFFRSTGSLQENVEFW
jgi:hypothetical protein